MVSITESNPEENSASQKREGKKPKLNFPFLWESPEVDCPD